MTPLATSEPPPGTPPLVRDSRAIRFLRLRAPDVLTVLVAVAGWRIFSPALMSQDSLMQYGEALRDPKTGARRWWCDEEPAADVLGITVENGDDFDARGLDVVFSATESDVAQVQEPRFAETTPQHAPNSVCDTRLSIAGARPADRRFGHASPLRWPTPELILL